MLPQAKALWAKVLIHKEIKYHAAAGYDHIYENLKTEARNQIIQQRRR
jgi:hypothetical protein